MSSNFGLYLVHYGCCIVKSMDPVIILWRICVSEYFFKQVVSLVRGVGSNLFSAFCHATLDLSWACTTQSLV